jgi:hypothetical protein
MWIRLTDPYPLTANETPATPRLGASRWYPDRTVTPDHTGHAVELQRLGTDGNWHDVAAGVVASGSTYSFSYTFGQEGSVELRARIYGGPENVGGAAPSATIAVSGVLPIASLPPAS